MIRDDDPTPALGPGPGPRRARAAAGDEGIPTLPVPELAERLGSLAGEADPGREPGGTVTASGRRVLVRVAPDGIQDIWAYPFQVSGPRNRDRGLAVLTGSALGVERRLKGEGPPMTEKTVASRDSPVVWVEWSANMEGPLDLEWEVAAYDPEPATVAWRALGPRVWQAATRGPSVSRVLFILSREPDHLDVREDVAGRGLRVRARARGAGDAGLRLAIVAAGPADDMARLVRVAGRPRIAVRARMGAVDRVRQEGLAVTAADPALGVAVERARIALALGPVEPIGPWTTAGLAATGMDHLASGGFGAARAILAFLVRHAQDDVGPSPIRGLGPAVTDRAEPGAAGSEWLPLLARYLAWSGDLATVRRWWPAVRRPGPSLGSAARDLAALAEDMGDAALAAMLRQQVPPDQETNRHPMPGGSVIRRVVSGLVGAEPDAVRGRLVLRPRLTGLSELEVRGLVVGEAAVDVTWERRGTGHHLEVSQGRGAAPLQLVLEPEVEGLAVAGVQVDGRAADLDVQQVGRTRKGRAQRIGAGATGASHETRWRVPVQLVLDRPRTLDVELDPG